MSFRVDVIKPEGYLHSRCLQDHATTIELSLKELKRYDERGRSIVFGAHLGGSDADWYKRSDPKAIFMNMEAHSSGWMTPEYLSLLATHDVLDYSAENVKWLRERGVGAWWLPIQYHPHLTRLPQGQYHETVNDIEADPPKLSYEWRDTTKDIDVLFYGSMTPRRLPILKAIQDAGFKCKWLAHEQWDQRDEMICRSKIVLNLHAYDGAPLEMARISYLLANGAFIISEGPADDEYKDVVMFQAANNLPLAIKFWLNDPGMRDVIAQRGFDQFSAKPQRDSLRSVLREMGAM